MGLRKYKTGRVFRPVAMGHLAVQSIMHSEHFHLSNRKDEKRWTRICYEAQSGLRPHRIREAPPRALVYGIVVKPCSVKWRSKANAVSMPSRRMVSKLTPSTRSLRPA